MGREERAGGGAGGRCRVREAAGGYSERRLWTGFMSAALSDWKLTVSIVTRRMPAPEAPKIHQERGARYW